MTWIVAAAAPANCRLSTLGRCLGLAVGDQLLDQAAIWCNIGEKPAHPLRCRAAPFDLGFRELGHVGHIRLISIDQTLPLAICGLERPVLCLQGSDLLVRDLTLVFAEHRSPGGGLDVIGLLHRGDRDKPIGEDLT
jgi:hypothetical protein